MQYLGGQGGDDGLCVDEGGVAQVVQAVRAEDGSSRLEPDWLLELDAAVAGALGDHSRVPCQCRLSACKEAISHLEKVSGSAERPAVSQP